MMLPRSMEKAFIKPEAVGHHNCKLASKPKSPVQGVAGNLFNHIQKKHAQSSIVLID